MNDLSLVAGEPCVQQASRDQQLRSVRVLCFGLASLTQLTTAVAKELTYSMLMKWSSCVGGPIGVDFVLVPGRR